MGTFVAIVGFGWAVLGLGNIVSMLSGVEGEVGNIEVFGFLLNMVLFVLPGIVIGAWGWNMKGRKERRDVARKAEVEAAVQAALAEREKQS